MSALVESMFSVREMPWHREGVILGEYPGSWAEARKQAGLEWEAISTAVPKFEGFDADGREVYGVEEGWQKIARSDTGATLYIRPSSYTIIGNEDMGGIVEAVLGQTNVKYETAGCLDGGKAVWVLVKLDEPFTVGGDFSETLPYLAFLTRHDGQGAANLLATSVRVVCANTFRAAEIDGKRSGATYSFRHTAKWSERIEEAREAVTGARREFAKYKELATLLFGITITPEVTDRFVNSFIPAPPLGLASDRVLGNVEAARKSVRAILESETTAPIAHTAYGLVQAATEYGAHVRTWRTWESRLNRTLLKPDEINRRAVNIIKDLVSV